MLFSVERFSGRRKKEEDAPAVESQVIEPQKVESPRVKAIRAVGKVHTPEEMAAWLELNKSYKMFLKYFGE